jgi:hypothetical protein
VLNIPGSKFVFFKVYSIPVRGGVYKKQLFVIGFVSAWRRVGVFFGVTGFPPQKKLTATK